MDNHGSSSNCSPSYYTNTLTVWPVALKPISTPKTNLLMSKLAHLRDGLRRLGD